VVQWGRSGIPAGIESRGLELDRLIAVHGKLLKLSICPFREDLPGSIGRRSMWCSSHKLVTARPIISGSVSTRICSGRFRDEYLNASWFISLADARHRLKLWRQD
jgi:putative transposase